MLPDGFLPPIFFRLGTRLAETMLYMYVCSDDTESCDKVCCSDWPLDGRWTVDNSADAADRGACILIWHLQHEMVGVGLYHFVFNSLSDIKVISRTLLNLTTVTWSLEPQDNQMYHMFVCSWGWSRLLLISGPRSCYLLITLGYWGSTVLWFATEPTVCSILIPYWCCTVFWQYMLTHD